MTQMQMPLANWNGEVMPLDQVRVSVLDRAFLFGDAVYEALRVYGGKAWLAAEHLARLGRSLAALGIVADLVRLERRMLETLSASQVKDGLIYIQVTRGVALRTHYSPPQPPVPNELIYVADLGRDPYAEKRGRGVAVITHPDLRWKRCDIKSVNLLGNCMAMDAAHRAGCVEAWLVNESGAITEATHSSAFAVRDGRIFAPPLGPPLLPGVTREFMVELASSLGIELVERPFYRVELESFDELFMTGTTMEILPVVSVDGRTVCGGRPGPVAERLYNAFQDRVAAFVAD